MLLIRAGARIYYDLVGPPAAGVVCFAHALAADSGMWAEQVPALVAQGWRVLRVDMRGHGGSASPDGDTTLDQLAGDIAAVVGSPGIRRGHFVGLAPGRLVAAALAL